MYPPSSRPTPPAPTPAAVTVVGGAAGAPPAVMDHHERMRMRAAAFRAKKLYPGPVGELISRELLAWEDFGFRLGGDQQVMQLVQHVMTAAEADVRPSA